MALNLNYVIFSPSKYQTCPMYSMSKLVHAKCKICKFLAIGILNRPVFYNPQPSWFMNVGPWQAWIFFFCWINEAWITTKRQFFLKNFFLTNQCETRNHFTIAKKILMNQLCGVEMDFAHNLLEVGAFSMAPQVASLLILTTTKWQGIPVLATWEARWCHIEAFLFFFPKRWGTCWKEYCFCFVLFANWVVGIWLWKLVLF